MAEEKNEKGSHGGGEGGVGGGGGEDQGVHRVGGTLQGLRRLKEKGGAAPTESPDKRKVAKLVREMLAPKGWKQSRQSLGLSRHCELRQHRGQLYRGKG